MTDGREPAKTAPDHIHGILAASADLRRANRQLVADLRQQINELRVERNRLISQRYRQESPHETPDALRARFGLTEREAEVALLLAEGRRNSAIAAALDISPHTARHHTQHVLAKLGVHSRAEAGARLRG